MKLAYRCVLLAILTIVCGLFLVRKVYRNGIGEIQNEQESKIDDVEAHLAPVGSYSGNETKFVIHLVLVVCGDRLKQAMICIKSALLFARSPLKVHIFAENELKKPLEDQLHSWRDSFDQHWTFVVQALSFPAESENEWKKLFKPCAAQRLFLPSAMNDTDAVIYVDIDTLFLSPVDILWDKFNFMNSSQMAALAPESEDFSTGWYNRFARHPYYGPLGLNSGVMLMNLTRFRRFQWELYLVPTYQQYKLNITWGDQDIINIIFHYHADKILVLPCEFNYRPDHCMYMSVCRTVENNGVYVLHGNRGAFINEKQPTFRAFYDSFNEFIPGEKLTSLVELVSAKFDATSPSNCGKMRKFLLKNLEY